MAVTRISPTSLITALLAFGLTSLAPHSFAANPSWPEGDGNCVEKGKGFERHCTLKYRNLAVDPITGTDHIFFDVRGTNFNNSTIKKAYEKQGLTAEKSDRHREAQFSGLVDSSGRTLLETIYEDIYTLSTTHSVVKLKDGETFKIAEHGTHNLTDLPVAYPLVRWKYLFDSETSLNVPKFLLIRYEEGNKTAQGGVLQPNLTVSPVMNNIDADHAPLTSFGSAFVVNTVDPETLERQPTKFDFRGKIVESNFQFETFEVASNFHYLRGYKDSRLINHMVQVGEAPRSTGLSDLRLYWPLDKAGNILPRPANIAGVRPLFPNEKGHYESWLIVIKAGEAFDYAIGILDGTSRPDKVVAALDDFYRLDDVVVYEDGKQINMKPALGGPIPSRWYLQSIIPRAVTQRFLETDAPGADTPQGALDYRQAELAKWEIEKAEKVDREAKQAAKDRENAWSNATRSASSCVVEYDRIFQIMMGGGGSATDADIGWALQYEKNKGKSCNQWPSGAKTQPDEAIGETPYTLNQGLQDMTRAMSCSTQTYDCTYIGNGMQSCSWVTKSIC